MERSHSFPGQIKKLYISSFPESQIQKEKYKNDMHKVTVSQDISPSTQRNSDSPTQHPTKYKRDSMQPPRAEKIAKDSFKFLKCDIGIFFQKC